MLSSRTLAQFLKRTVLRESDLNRGQDLERPHPIVHGPDFFSIEWEEKNLIGRTLGGEFPFQRALDPVRLERNFDRHGAGSAPHVKRTVLLRGG